MSKIQNFAEFLIFALLIIVAVTAPTTTTDLSDASPTRIVASKTGDVIHTTNV